MNLWNIPISVWRQTCIFLKKGLLLCKNAITLSFSLQFRKWLIDWAKIYRALCKAVLIRTQGSLAAYFVLCTSHQGAVQCSRNALLYWIQLQGWRTEPGGWGIPPTGYFSEWGWGLSPTTFSEASRVKSKASVESEECFHFPNFWSRINPATYFSLLNWVNLKWYEAKRVCCDAKKKKKKKKKKK